MITESKIKAAVRKAEANPGRNFWLTDDGARGAGRLGFRARGRASGGVSAVWFALYYRQSRLLTSIANYPDLSLADARKKFREEYAPAISAGADPKVKQVRRRHSEKDTSATVEELFRGYVENLKRAEARSAKDVERYLLHEKTGAARVIGADRLASAVAPEDIVAVLMPIFDRGAPAMADITRSWLHAAFEFGLKAPHDYRSKGTAMNYGVTVNPVAAVKRDEHATQVGNRVLSVAEFKLYWGWLEEEKKQNRIAYEEQTRMLIGQRVEEVLRMNEHGFDHGMKTFYWPKTKNKLPHLIPLPPRAIDLLDEIGTNHYGMYFPHKVRPAEPAKMNVADYIVRKFIAETGTPHFVPRDIRRTWKTLTGRAGIAKDIRDKLQNHAQNEDVSSRHYDRYDYLAEKRAAMAKWAEFMDKIIAGEIDDRAGPGVVPMPGVSEVAA